MADVWITASAAEKVRQLLDDSLKGLPHGVRTALPKKWTPKDGTAVTVVSDGAPVSDRAWTREVVRVTVHSRDIVSARRVMTLIDGILTTPSIRTMGLPIQPATGIIAAADSKVSGYMSSAAYTVSLPRIAMKEVIRHG